MEGTGRMLGGRKLSDDVQLPMQKGELPLQSQFHIIGVQRRMADWSFEKAQTWEDLLAAHEKWLRDYNVQRVRHVGACRIPFTERRG